MGRTAEARPPAPAGGGAEYDLAVIGSGSAAFAAAIRATALGARVALIERGTVGGTCVNTGCIPSKNLLAAAEAYHQAGHHPFGGVFTAQQGTDLAAITGVKDRVVARLRAEKYLDLAGHYGIEIITGHGRFTGPDVIEVSGRQVRAARFIVATGSAASVPPIDGLADAGYLTSATAMTLTRLPESLVVVGGNYVGLEMGQLFARLGAQVTIVEAQDRIAPGEEPEVSAWMRRILAGQGIGVVTAATVTQVQAGPPSTVVTQTRDGQRRLAAERILVATGRRPVLDGLSLEAAGIGLDSRGALILDEQLRTTNPRVYAAGDVTGAPQFVYVAAAQGTLAAGNALAGAGRAMDYLALPKVTFTTPNIASAGLTEHEARRAGHDCECRVLELDQVPRAIVNLDTGGMVKLVAERGSGKVLGVHAVAANAGEAILAGVYAIRFGLTVTDLASTWAPYLTMAEGIKLAAQAFTTDVALLSCCAA
jgi:mercuric reductase